MTNKTLETFKSNADFSFFINSRFKKDIGKMRFPDKYEQKRPPKTIIADKSNPEVKNIIDRELIRDNIFVQYKFDIYEYPIVVFYENNSKEILKPFKLPKEAEKFSNNLLDKGYYSLMINIMKDEIDCKLYK